MRPPVRRLCVLRLDHADESTKPARGPERALWRRSQVSDPSIWPIEEW